MNKECNIRFVTLDACRYDSAVRANTPNLDFIGPLRKSETAGSFTYPAHHTFFIGNLPRIIEDNSDYLPGISQIWRSSEARGTAKSVLIPFEGSSIVDYYQKKEYNVHGFGGVGFFNTNNENNSLPQLFKNFHFLDSSAGLNPDQKLPRVENTLPLGNLDLIVETLDREPYFLFINSPETHIPYDVPTSKVNSKYTELISRLYDEQNKKVKYEAGNLPFTKEEIELLKANQIAALEWIDGKLGQLFEKLPSTYPTLTIVCADHGEEFGDNGRFGHAHVDESVMTVPIWVGYTE